MDECASYRVRRRITDVLSDGDGEWIFPDGSSLRGTFRSDTIEGYGVFTHSDGSSVGTRDMMKMWADAALPDTQVCLRLYRFSCDEGKQYAHLTHRSEGSYVEGALSGLVREYRNDGTIEFVGDYADGARHGEGILHFPEGSTIRGKWRDGVLSGEDVVFEYQDGCRLVGTWEV